MKNIFKLALLSACVFSTTIHAETFSEAASRSGAVLTKVDLNGYKTYKAGNYYVIEWEIDSYKNIASLASVEYPDGRKKQYGKGISYKKIDGEYSIGSQKSKTYKFRTNIAIPDDVPSGKAKIGFYVYDLDKKKSKGMYALIPSGTTNYPTDGQAKRFKFDIEGYVGPIQKKTNTGSGGSFRSDESDLEAGLRSGSILSSATGIDNFKVGRSHTVEWSIYSYLDIASEFVLGNGKNQKRFYGIPKQIEDGEYSIGNLSSKKYTYRATVKIPEGTSEGNIMAGFYTFRKDDSPSDRKKMFALIPDGKVDNVNSQAKQFGVSMKAPIPLNTNYKPRLNTPQNGAVIDGKNETLFSWDDLGVNYRIVFSTNKDFNNFLDDGGNSKCKDPNTNPKIGNICWTGTVTQARKYKAFSAPNTDFYWKIRGVGTGWSEVSSFKTKKNNNYGSSVNENLVNDFVNRKKGKRTNMDLSHGSQCVDLVHSYIQEVLGVRRSSHNIRGHAFNFAENLANKTIQDGSRRVFFKKILNTPSGLPQKGDIMFWKIGGYGHVGIFLEGDLTNFYSLDQNWAFDLNKGTPAKIEKHNYKNVAGWLRPEILSN